VGYWIGSDRIVTSEQSETISTPEHVIPISAAAPDLELLNSRGATIRIHGLFGASVGTSTERLDVIAQYAIIDSAGPTPVYVWSHRVSPSQQTSPSALFAMPMGNGISLTIDHVSKSGSGGTPIPSQHVTFTAVASGVYFVALNPSIAPAWSSLVFMENPAAGSSRSLFQRTLSGMQIASFPFLMVSVAPIDTKIRTSY
jgi:hypothetical protein